MKQPALFHAFHGKIRYELQSLSHKPDVHAQISVPGHAAGSHSSIAFPESKGTGKSLITSQFETADAIVVFT